MSYFGSFLCIITMHGMQKTCTVADYRRFTVRLQLRTLLPCILLLTPAIFRGNLLLRLQEIVLKTVISIVFQGSNTLTKYFIINSAVYVCNIVFTCRFWWHFIQQCGFCNMYMNVRKLVKVWPTLRSNMEWGHLKLRSCVYGSSCSFFLPFHRLVTKPSKKIIMGWNSFWSGIHKF